MLSGPLDRRMTWQAATVTKADTGGDVRTWADVFTTWCAKVDIRGAELVAALETVDEETVKLEIRWRDGLAPGPNVRFLFEDKTWRVHAVTEIGRREGWAITGRTRADGGTIPA